MVRIAAVPGDEKLWPRWSEPARTTTFRDGRGHMRFTPNTSLGREADSAPAPPAEPFDLAARAAQIRQEFGKTRRP